MNIFMWFRLAVLLSISGTGVLYASANFQTHDSITDSVRRFLSAEYAEEKYATVSVKSLDHRLKLAACETPLQNYWPHNLKRTGNVSVAVACEGEKPWKIYVQASVALIREVAVLKRPAVRGEVLDESMIRFAKRDVSRAGKHFLSNVSDLIGYRFRQSAQEGKVLVPRMLEAPYFVERGDGVSIVSNSRLVQVSMKGEALASGIKGDRIRVKNLSSGRVIHAEVFAKGIVKVLK